MDDLWWLPSLIVFGGVGIIVWLLLAFLRRRNPKTPIASIDDLHRRAGIALVRTDDAVREAEDEVGFAEAEFGREAARGYAADVASARAALGEAFRLRQLLEDEIADTERQRREWNERIVHLCEDVERTLTARLRGFAERRGAERSAPELLGDLERRIDRARERLTTTGLAIASAAERYAASAVEDARVLRRTAQTTVDQAAEDARHAAERITDGRPTAAALHGLGRELQQAEDRLDAVERALAGIGAAEAELAAAARELRTVVAEATELRESAERPETADVMAGAIDRANRALLEAESATSPDGERILPDPARRLETVRAADIELDAALATARSERRRLDNAREAMRGAMFTAESNLRIAADVISAHRDRVGADARTRLAEAKRQLALAEAAAADDPVEALDAARRASRIAQDADALARYDLG
ncbi:hypothetical protein ITJ57_17430 [Plantibacter sp. VKM Ac-2880]|uniref:hypothetical protein n=1 Tax=Plantibacter sp. VKM Ac-2880 TaxID=2783827 RepID=UPI00188E0696|nr:hypothetical protein [Plantibacter sp. VKM Ac-2880]MBF4570551.1 hypothetical protein [Plantibacter sp. VKM Ac-2880]